MYEINLVPEVKHQMIKALKMRNLIFFICIMVMIGSGVMLAITGSIVGAQKIASASKEQQISEMSKKLNDYSSLGEFLTIQDQMGKIAEITENKKVLSRVFNVLDAFRPQGKDTVAISELNVNLETSTLSFDAQADAGENPLIDYRVLESYKKGMSLTKYDYGRYVDEDGNEIPTRCLRETDDNGNILMDNGSIYAIWHKGVDGCDPAKEYEEDEEDEEGEEDEEATSAEEEEKAKESVEEQANPEDDVKIWRTPQFKEWYAKDKIDTGGTIMDVPHFESACITYSGVEDGDEVKWSADNSCMIVDEDPVIRDSSNGRDASGNLVLRFSATVVLNPEVLSFQNKHMMAISPTGQNVTDSYRQVEGMFAKRAEDCGENDTTCLMSTTNSTGE